MNPNFTTRFFQVQGTTTSTLTLNKTAGDSQTGVAGQALATQLEVEVRDANNAVQPGVAVTFRATSGGGVVVPLEAATDSQGRASTKAYLGAGSNQRFTASSSTLTVTFAATAQPSTISSINFVDPSANALTKELVVNEGNTIQGKLRVLDSTGRERTDVSVTYASSNPDVATVDSAANIQGKRAGFSTLTVSGAGVVATATITVVQVNAGVAGIEATGVAQDLANRLYLAANQDHTIRLLQSIGQTPEVYAGKSQAPGLINDVRLQSLFKNPAFIAFDQAEGSLYVSDSANNVIRRVRPGPSGTAETFAGTGSPGNQDGALQAATFSNPQGIALDGAGYLWLADAGNHTIRRISLAGRTVETIAGQAGSPGSADGGGNQARFNSPLGIAVEPEKLSHQLDRFFHGGSPPPVRVVVADTGNGRIRRVAENGQVETIILAGVTSVMSESKVTKQELTSGVPLRFASPTGVAVDPFGNIYVTEPGQGQVKTILQNGGVVSAVQANTFTAPKGIVIALSNRVVVTDSAQPVREIRYGEPQITSITPDHIGNRGGATVTIRGRNFAPDTQVVAAGVLISNAAITDTETISFIAPALDSGRTTVTVQTRGGLAQTSLAIDPVPVSQLPTGYITTVAGGATFTGDGGAALSANLYVPMQLVIDASGNLFFADYLHFRVRKVDARTHVVTTVAGTGIEGRGGDGNPASATPLSPGGIALDASGNLYIAESGTSAIRKVDLRTGIISTVPGTAGTAGVVNGRAGLLLDSSGMLYTVSSSALRRWNLQTGTVTILADTGGLDSAGAAIDAAQNLYFVDQDNFKYRIRKVDAATGAITTVAGGGSGFPLNLGDGGPATAAILQYPQAMIVDTGGNLYITDAYGVRKVDGQTGIITTVAGSTSFGPDSGDDGPATSAKLYLPGGLAFDSAGNLYIADSSNNRIRKVEAQTQIIRAFAGTGQRTSLGDNGPATAAGLNLPMGVALDLSGNMYIADPFEYRIRKVDGQTGIITTAAGTGLAGFSGDNGPAPSASLNFANSQVADSAGNVYIADTTNYRIRKVDSQTRIITTVVGTGQAGFAGDNGPATEAGLGHPTDVALDLAGNLYIATDDNRIRKVNLQTGIITTVAGAGGVQGFSGDNGPATAAALSLGYLTSTIGLDSSGNLYIADTNNHRIRNVDAQTGIITTVAGTGQPGLAGDGGPATAARLFSPSGVTVDSAGNFFIGDSGNDRARKVGADGTITSAAGAGRSAPIGDNGPASAASLFSPRAVKIDAAGNLIISDTSNTRIRAVRGPVN